MPKLDNNLTVLQSETSDLENKVNTVVSSVVIVYVLTKYNVKVKPHKDDFLLKCLRLPAEKGVCSAVMKTINSFDRKILR